LIKEANRNETKYRMRLERDTLTKVHSRVYIQEIVDKTFEIKDGKDEIGLAVLDLDNFKRINDIYGHDNGDVVLERLGGLLNQYVSDDIIVGRFGGEEFVIIFRGQAKNYYDTIEEIRQRFSEFTFEFMKDNKEYVCSCPITNHVQSIKNFLTFTFLRIC
jgi:diguanylate cyclase (GGDEF)-like protein